MRKVLVDLGLIPIQRVLQAGYARINRRILDRLVERLAQKCVDLVCHLSIEGQPRRIIKLTFGVVILDDCVSNTVRRHH
jgi:hypothetical protein